jgi:recombinational DNA repair ATPase RecF
MAVDPFAERLARVRQRFVSALESKIEDTYAAIPDLLGETSAVIETALHALRETAASELQSFYSDRW